MRYLFFLIFAAGIYTAGSAQEHTITERKGKFGVKTQNYELKPRYESYMYSDKTDAYLFLEKKYTLLMLNIETGELYELFDEVYDYTYNDSLIYDTDMKIRIKKNGKVGLYYFPDKEIIPPLYDNVFPVYDADSLCILQKDGNLFSIINIEKNEQTRWFYSDNYEHIFNIDNLLAYPILSECIILGRKEEPYIYCWTGEQYPVVGHYSYSEPYLSESATIAFPVQKDGKVAFLGKWGYFFTSHLYDDAKFPLEDIAPAKLNGKWGLADMEGNVIIPFVYEDISPTDYMDLKLTGKTKTIRADEYGNPTNFGEAVYYPKKNKFGYPHYKKRGMALPAVYDYAEDFSEGFAAVNKGGSFSEEAETISGGKWGYILPTGDVHIDFIYDTAHSFSGGRAMVTKDGKSFYIDVYGEELDEP